VDVDFEHHVALGPRNDVVWGLGARIVNSEYGIGYDFAIVPNRRLDSIYSAFLQDQLKLTNSLSLTFGSKFERNSISGFEYEPSAQLVWTPTEEQTVWVSASRAIREPSPIDVGLQDDAAIVPLGSSFAVVTVLGNPNIKAEEFRDLELGYRALASKRVSLDATAFTGLYRNLESLAALTPYVASQQGVPYLVLPELFVNGGRASTYGAEFFANWNITGRFRISPGYSYFHMNVDGDSATLATPTGVSPNHQFQVRSLLDLPHHLEWDNTIGYVSKLADGNIPAYTRVDSRIGWRVGEFVEISVVGQNLLTPRHVEFSDTTYPLDHTLVERSVFGKVTWRF
jgi:iron complex outermembrane recepter protein